MRRFWRSLYERRALLFWPLIVAGGRLVARVILNVWNMIEG